MPDEKIDPAVYWGELAEKWLEGKLERGVAKTVGEFLEQAIAGGATEGPQCTCEGMVGIGEWNDERGEPQSGRWCGECGRMWCVVGEE